MAGENLEFMAQQLATFASGKHKAYKVGALSNLNGPFLAAHKAGLKAFQLTHEAHLHNDGSQGHYAAAEAHNKAHSLFTEIGKKNPDASIERLVSLHKKLARDHKALGDQNYDDEERDGYAH